MEKRSGLGEVTRQNLFQKLLGLPTASVFEGDLHSTFFELNSNRWGVDRHGCLD